MVCESRATRLVVKTRSTVTVEKKYRDPSVHSVHTYRESDSFGRKKRVKRDSSVNRRRRRRRFCLRRLPGRGHRRRARATCIHAVSCRRSGAGRSRHLPVSASVNRRRPPLRAPPIRSHCRPVKTRQFRSLVGITLAPRIFPANVSSCPGCPPFHILFFSQSLRGGRAHERDKQREGGHPGQCG